MILIADSGSTKTDWCIVFNGTPIKRIGTKGINPFFQSEEEIQQELTHSLLPQLPEGTINSVFFMVQDALPKRLPSSGGLLPTACPSSGTSKPTRICLPLPADYADMKLGLPASSAQVPIPVSTTVKRLSTTSPLLDSFWEMKEAAQS